MEYQVVAEYDGGHGTLSEHGGVPVMLRIGTPRLSIPVTLTVPFILW